MSQTKPRRIAHFLHPQHPLHLQENGSDGAYICDGCKGQFSVSDGRTTTGRYRCTYCDFDLDEACALTSSGEIMSTIIPLSIVDNFRHPNHTLRLCSGADPYVCDGCGNKSPKGGVRYYCTDCKFDLDWACAISVISISDNKLSNVASNAPNEIPKHFRHYNHSLTLFIDSNAYFCNGCGRIYPEGGTRYCCKTCEFNLDWCCAKSTDPVELKPTSSNLPHVIRGHFRHCRHPLTLQWVNTDYRCDCCGMVSSAGCTTAMYICNLCDYGLDWFCALSSHPVYLIPESSFFCGLPYYPECFDIHKCVCHQKKRTQNQNQTTNPTQHHKESNVNQSQIKDENQNQQNERRSKRELSKEIARRIAKEVAEQLTVDSITQTINQLLNN